MYQYQFAEFCIVYSSLNMIWLKMFGAVLADYVFVSYLFNLIY